MLNESELMQICVRMLVELHDGFLTSLFSEIAIKINKKR